MKVSSKTLESAAKPSNQNDSPNDSLGLPNEAVFNQLLQLLTQLTPAPAQGEKIEGASLNPEALNKIDNNINGLFSNLDMITTQGGTDKLINQSDQVDIKLPDDVSTKLNLTQDQMEEANPISDSKLMEPFSINDYISNQFSENKLTEDKQLAYSSSKQDVIVNEALKNTLPDGLMGQWRDSGNAKKMVNPNLSNAMEIPQTVIDNLNQDNPSILNTSYVTKQAEKTNGKLNDQSNEISEILLPSASFSPSHQLGTSELNSTTATFDMANALKEDQNNKYTDAFIHLGHFINNQTTQLPLEANLKLENQIKSDSAMSMAGQFDPAHDFKLDVSSTSTGSHLNSIYDARIKIHPPELGELIAKLKMDNDGAQLTILTENNHVKQIVESNLALLKQHFQDADIPLTQIDVQSPQSGNKGQENNQQTKQQDLTYEQPNEIKQNTLTSKAPRVADNAIIDTYA